MTVLIPEDLKSLAQRRAEELGLSLDEMIGDALRAHLERVSPRDRRNDPLFRDVRVYEGDAPADSALNHDKYLYGDED